MVSPRSFVAVIATLGVLLSAAATAVAQDRQPPAPPSRPAGLMPLYVSFAGVQALDVHSTLRGVRNGSREANPLMGGVVGSPAAFMAVKAGATAGTIYLTEKMWKRSRKAAIITMIGANIAYGLVVSHNYRVGQTVK